MGTVTKWQPYIIEIIHCVYCVVNNTYEPQDTTVYIGDGCSFELHMEPNEIKWYQIQ